MKPTRSEENPVDYLGVAADDALKTIEGHGTDIRAVIFLEDDRMCMTALGGWDSDTDAVAAVLAHLTKVFEANGKTLVILPMGRE